MRRKTGGEGDGGGRQEVRGMGRKRAIEGEIRQLEEEEERR